MKQKIQRILNIIMGSFIGVFIGSGLYRYWYFRKYPDLYIMQSAPWYTGILVQGLFTLVLLAVCLIIKVVLIKDIGAMKKAALILGIIFLFLTFTGGGYVLVNLFACGKNTNLIDMSIAEGDEYMAIIWEDRTYVPYCTISKNDCGTQIGYLNGETNDRICEYKDYSTDEWIANYLTVDGGAILFKEVNVTHIPDGLESEYEWNISEIAKLHEKYPEYFELGTFKGLEVYVWQMAEGEYRFGLMQGTNRKKTLEEKMALKGATLEEMALILSTFDIEDGDIFVIPWQNPISSYMVTEDMMKDPEYIDNVRMMLGLDLDEE